MLGEGSVQQLSELLPLAADDRTNLEQELLPATAFQRYGVIRHQGEPPDAIYLLVEGWVCSSVTLRSGERQLMNVHLPGDLMGTASLCLKEAADMLYALTPVIVRKLPAAKFGALFARSPGFAARMFIASQREGVRLMDRVTAVGAKRAIGRLSALLLDFHERLSERGMVRDNEFQLRLTQDEIGDYLGLTAVHVNRTFRQLEQQGVISRRLQRIRLLDIAALQESSGFVSRRIDPNCLNLFPER